MKRLILIFQFFVSLGLVIFFSGCQKEDEPVVPINKPPRIIKIEADAQIISANSKVYLYCNAIDEDNDSLKFSWSSKRGSFLNQNQNTITWLAPSTQGTDTIFVEAFDGKSKTTGNITIKVGNAPAQPILTSPLNNSKEVSLSPILNWERSNSSSEYFLQVSEDSLFNGFILSRRTKNNFIQLDNFRINTKYFWRVRANNESGFSGWSKIFSFVTVAPPATPALISPKNNSIDVPLNSNLTWEKISNAEKYYLEIASDDSFSKNIFSYAIDSLNAFTPGNLINYQKYFWRIKAINKYGESNWTEAFNFTAIGKAPETPAPTYPVNNSANHNLVTKLTWEKVEHVNNYSLQFSTDSLFTTSVITPENILRNEYEIDSLEYWAKYFWRIKANNQYGQSSWSSTNSFITKLASPTQIESDIVDQGRPLSPEIKWQTINGAEGYTLQVAKDSSFNDLVYVDSTLQDPKHRIPRLEDYTEYFWRIKSNNSLGFSDWSPIKKYFATGFYYQGLPYGNQAVYSPTYVLLNGGFDMIQVGNKRDIKNFPYKIAFKNIWRNFTNPFSTIKAYGWEPFLKDQVFPLSLNKDNAQFWPNYSLHLIGGGMEYAQLREWYKFNNYPYPSLLSAATVMSYHLINEVAENGAYQGPDVDPIADFFIFDIGGIILFSSESVKQFFAEELNLSDWSQQPSFSLRNGELHNNGQFFSVKWKFPFSSAWHLFYYFGTNGVAGLSYKYKDGDCISGGIGLAAGDLILLNEKTNKKTLGLVGNFAVFYDRNNSLLAALSVTIKTDYMINLNIYPGVLKFGGISPGLWGAYSQNGNYFFGFTFSWLPFGFSHSTK